MLVAFSYKQSNKLSQLQKSSIEFTYSDFPFHLEVNTDKLALINRLWKCKKSKRLTITSNSFTKIDQHDGFPSLWRPG